MSSELEELYQDLILDHFKRPRCCGCLESPAARSDVVNPLCGDQITLTISTKDNTVDQIRFTGKGCSISQASASMMSEACQGKSEDEIRTIIAKFRGFMKGEYELSDLQAAGGDLVALNGVRKYSARIKCALLPWDAIMQCLDSLRSP